MALAERTTIPGVAAEATRLSKKRRRPSGEPPPLPRHLYASGMYWLSLAGIVVGLWFIVLFIAGAGAAVTRVEVAFLQDLAALRTPWLTRAARWVEHLGSEWAMIPARWGLLLALVFFKRFRHLFVLLGSILGVGLITSVVAQLVARARPLEVEILGSWEGASHPSRPVAALAVTLLGITYTLVPAGRWRSRAKWASAAIVAAVSASRLYLAVDHPTDVIAATIIGVTIPLVAFRLLAPNDIFPVTYKRRRAAHLDVDGPRGDAIRAAIEQQVGVTIVDVEPFGLGGSAGSTPLRLTVAGEPPAQLFAKLYAQSHLRADRWYKLGRTLLYGRLEDEGSFGTVRRLVQYEDYMLRVMRDAKLPTPRPYGFVEITPEREYVLLTDFVPQAKELLDADITDDVIDQCLALIRRLWDAGIAHRDVKPSNILVARGKVHLIDVAFGEVRPSPWRQAVDLANMMLVDALRTDAERVHRAALRHFTDVEISEAFAATHGVTIPSQTRALMKADSRDLLAEFRELTPKCKPISIQRWSVRRVGLTAAALLSALLMALLVVSNFRGAGLQPPQDAGHAAYSGVTRAPECEDTGDPAILLTQAVPSARLLPCVEPLPLGWSYSGMDVVDGRARLFLDSDRAGFHAVDVTLTRSCDLDGATEVPTDEPGTRRYERVVLRQDRYAGSRYYVFEGGCVTYAFDFGGAGRTALADEASVALGFVSRAELARFLATHDLAL
ncbi:MAG TPA: phosphatase PAP2 family protein [Actinomycetota bacterium]|nr:phosphatase PAP2 family protein [Actinomycetota bacterium]